MSEITVTELIDELEQIRDEHGESIEVVTCPPHGPKPANVAVVEKEPWAESENDVWVVL